MTGVVVTGMGVVSPIGASREAFWSAALAGHNGVRPLQYPEIPPGHRLFGGQIPKSILDQEDFDTRLSAGSVFALVAAREAVAHAALADDGALAVDPRRCGVSLGSGTGNPRLTGSATLRWKRKGLDAVPVWMTRQIPPTAAGLAVATEWGLRGPHHVFTTSCMAGNNAIAQAVAVLRAGRADVMLAGGTEGLSWAVANGFRMLTTVKGGGALERCQPFSADRRGVVVGEGAGILVLERREHAAARGARAYAEILGCGFGSDAFHMSTPHPEGRGGAAALGHALRLAGVTADEIDYVSAHGTGSQTNDIVETKILKSVLGARAHQIPVSSIKSMIGHSLGAASAIEAIACTLAIRDGRLPPTINHTTFDPACDLDYVPNQARDHAVEVAVSNAFAFGGACSALVLARAGSAVWN